MEHPAAGTSADATFKIEDAASYDSVVDDFDLLTNRYTVPIAEKVIVLADILPGHKVLDVGCGTGVLTLLAAREVGARGRVVGFDLSDGMLAKAKAIAQAGQYGDRVEFVKGDAERMQFPDAGFHSVVSLYALRHFPDPEQALREMFRCSVPGGQTLVAVGSAPPLFSGAFLKAGMRVFSDLVLGLAGRAPLCATAFLDQLIGRRLGGFDHGEHAAWTHGVKQYSGTVAALMRRVGYRKIRSAWVGHAAVLDSVQEFWTLQVTLSSYARKRMQAASPTEIDGLRTAFDGICGRHRARGGHLVYRSGALITTGRRPGP
jgi:ubiquinone/menaquinone biosynthesis C-methylase UbiE